MAEQAELGPCGGDALHLANAAVADSTLATLDKKQAEAGRKLGVGTLLLPVPGQPETSE